MVMVDASGRDETEGQSGLGREETQSVQGYIAIKGTRNGLLLTLEPGTPFIEVLNALSDRLAEAPGFFRGASLAVDTSRRVLGGSERTQLENLLATYQMSVTPLEDLATARRESDVGILTPSGLGAFSKTGPLSEAQPAQRTGPLSVSQPAQYDLRASGDTLFLRRTVRSGQAIHHPSNIVVLGDVNHGAEIVAGGDVIVWGVLRGMVHAGYPDNEQAYVCSLLLAPVQLRIAHLLSRPPEGADVQPRPEVAAIRNGRIVVETWVNGRPPRK